MRLSKFIFLGLFVCSTSAFAEKFYDVQCNDHNGDSIFSSLIKTSDANIFAISQGGFNIKGVSQFGNLVDTAKKSLDDFGVDTSSCNESGNTRVFVLEFRETQTELYCASGKIDNHSGDLEAYAKRKFDTRRSCIFLLDSATFQAFRNR